LRAASAQERGPREIRDARRPAVREWLAASRALPQQDPQGRRGEARRDERKARRLRPGLGLPWTADRAAGRQAARREEAADGRERPVHWCFVDVTALAEAEVEYFEKTSPSIYVAFRVLDGTKLYKLAPSLKGHPLALAIWTTTPWTIPANLAIAANPEIEYVAYDLGARAVIVAKDLLAQFLAACAPDEVQQGGGNPETVLGAAQNAGRVPRLKDPRKVLAHF